MIDRQVLRAVIDQHGGLDTAMARVADDADLYSLGMTSHAAVNVMLAVEDAFDIELPDAFLVRSTFRTIDNLATALAAVARGTVPPL